MASAASRRCVIVINWDVLVAAVRGFFWQTRAGVAMMMTDGGNPD